MKKILFVLCALIIGSATLLSGCKKDSGSDNSALLSLLASTGGTYGGTTPVGDFIEVSIDRINKTVRRINYTTNDDSGIIPYTEVSVADAYGFSIVNRAEVGGGSYVLFSEFPGAAVVYQLFDGTDTPVDWPVYVVKKSDATAGDYYGKAYNWMKFFINSGTESDMECGFAAFDAASTGGFLYGAGYSNRAEAEGDTAINSINPGTLGINSFTWDDTMKAFVNYSGGTTMDYALTLTGTPSGSGVLDFGPERGGGGALAIPQASNKEFKTSYAGTYFAVMYEYKKFAPDDKTVMPIKVVINNYKTVKVFYYDDHTDETGSPLFSSILTPLADFNGGPNAPTTTVIQDFQSASGNASAVSSVVQNAHLCHGSFIATFSGTVLVVTFDPSGRFASYTLFNNNGTDADDTDDIIRFGFAVKDAHYTNSF